MMELKEELKRYKEENIKSTSYLEDKMNNINEKQNFD